MKKRLSFVFFCLALFFPNISFSEENHSFNCALLTNPDNGVTYPHFDLFLDSKHKNTYVIACQSTTKPGVVTLEYIYCDRIFYFVINDRTTPFHRVVLPHKTIVIPRTSEATILITVFCLSSPPTST